MTFKIITYVLGFGVHNVWRCPLGDFNNEVKTTVKTEFLSDTEVKKC